MMLVRLLRSDELANVAAELLYEGGCLDYRGGWYQELAGNPEGLAIDWKSSL